jgi:hypothetical protein
MKVAAAKRGPAVAKRNAYNRYDGELVTTQSIQQSAFRTTPAPP